MNLIHLAFSEIRQFHTCRNVLLLYKDYGQLLPLSNILRFGWKSADIATLVQEWMDGTYDNYGFVMIQNEDMSPYSRYNSRENDNFF